MVLFCFCFISNIFKRACNACFSVFWLLNFIEYLCVAGVADIFSCPVVENENVVLVGNFNEPRLSVRSWRW